MSEQLYKHISNYVNISEDEFDKIQKYFNHHTYKKKENLITSGDKCAYNYFVIAGCLQLYYMDEKGTNRTVQFALENWWMTDNLAFIKQQKTDFTIQAVETSSVLSISFEQQENLLAHFPQLEKYFRCIYQVAYGASMVRLKYVYGFSKEERYFHFINHFPEFAQRVPQYLMASFLGLTPEYVSEIRAKRGS